MNHAKNFIKTQIKVNLLIFLLTLFPIKGPERSEGAIPIKISERSEDIILIKVSEQSEETIPIKIPKQSEGIIPIPKLDSKK